ncbi:hypothetical protein GH733_010064, partial [Mirounga leonina]
MDEGVAHTQKLHKKCNLVVTDEIIVYYEAKSEGKYLNDGSRVCRRCGGQPGTDLCKCINMQLLNRPARVFNRNSGYPPTGNPTWVELTRPP